MTSRSIVGIVLAGIYVLVCFLFIITQGLFGESFIALILGMPWSLALAYIEYGNTSGIALAALLIVPMILNACILYGIGYLLAKGATKKLLLIIALVAGLLIAVFYVLNAYIYAEKQRGPDIVSYRGSLTGEQVCLPHADTDGPQTLECALGMRTDAGEYYALDFGTFPEGLPPLQTGDRFTATGLITPIEMLSSDHWRKYDIEGILSVTEAVEKR